MEAHRGLRGMKQLRRTLPLIDPRAEPQETSTRLVLIDGGLPTPQTQIVVRDEWGVIVARIDMGWENWHVGVEFDGAQHWTDPSQRAKDIDRAAELSRLGWVIIRVSYDLLAQPTRSASRTRPPGAPRGRMPDLLDRESETSYAFRAQKRRGMRFRVDSCARFGGLLDRGERGGDTPLSGIAPLVDLGVGLRTETLAKTGESLPGRNSHDSVRRVPSPSGSRLYPQYTQPLLTSQANRLPGSAATT